MARRLLLWFWGAVTGVGVAGLLVSVRGRATPPAVVVAGAPAAGSPVPSRYVVATEAVRTTAKWLLAALAALGATLVAGLQLSGLGGLTGSEWPRLLLAAASATVAFTAIGVMIAEVAAILTDEWVTLSELSYEVFAAGLEPRSARRRADLLTRLQEKVDEDKQELFGSFAPSVAVLHRRLREANTAAAEGHAGSAELAAQLRAAATEVAQFANYYRTLWRYQTARRRMLRAACAAVLGVGCFAYATHTDEPRTVRVEIAAPAQSGGMTAAPPSASPPLRMSKT